MKTATISAITIATLFKKGDVPLTARPLCLGDYAVLYARNYFFSPKQPIRHSGVKIATLPYRAKTNLANTKNLDELAKGSKHGKP